MLPRNPYRKYGITEGRLIAIIAFIEKNKESFFSEDIEDFINTLSEDFILKILARNSNKDFQKRVKLFGLLNNIFRGGKNRVQN